MTFILFIRVDQIYQFVPGDRKSAQHHNDHKNHTNTEGKC